MATVSNVKSQSVPKDGRFSTVPHSVKAHSASRLNPSRRTAGSAPSPRGPGASPSRRLNPSRRTAGSAPRM